MDFVLQPHSKDRLATCDQRLQDVVNAATKDAPFEFLVVYGYRGKSQQDSAVASGHSKLSFPNSKHNAMPSLAVDLAPYIDQQIPWNDTAKFDELADHIRKTARSLGIQIQWGGDLWKSFVDKPHFQLPDQWPHKEQTA